MAKIIDNPNYEGNEGRVGGLTASRPINTYTPPGQIKNNDDLTPDMGWEFTQAAKHPFYYPLTRTAADILPFVSLLVYPSAQKEFAEASLGKKALTLGLDAAVFLPASWIGKGAKVLLKPLGKVAEVGAKAIIPKSLRNLRLLTIEEAPSDLLTGIMRDLDTFVETTAKGELMKGFKLSEEEAEAVISGNGKVWQNAGRSGGALKDYTEGTRQFFDSATGLKKTKWKKKIAQWNRSPELQRFAYEKQTYIKYLKGNLQVKGREIPRIFDSQVNALFGSENIGKITMKNITAEDFNRVLLDTLINKSAILRRVDMNPVRITAPFRIIAGKWEKLYGTNTLFEKIKGFIGTRNEAALSFTTKFQDLMVANNLGKYTEKGVFKELFSGTEYKEAEELIRKLDNFQQAGKDTKGLELGYSTNAQRLARTYQQWTDFMYSEHLKTQIPRIIRNAGLTQEGEDALVSILSPYGEKFGSYITEALAGGNNLNYQTKLGFLNNILKKIRGEIEANAGRWLADPSEENVKALLSSLDFAKGNKEGILNYLDNYGQRFYTQGGKAGSGISNFTRPGYTKQRSVEETESVITDISELVIRRSRQQANFTHLSPEMKGLREEINKLPRNLKDTFNHYLARLTGGRSETDRKVAQFLNKKLKSSLTQDQISSFGYTLNDLVYMGGLGLKPSFGVLNMFQPFITVPADMGGITNYYWLLKGFKRGYSPETRQWIRDAGIISEYIPEVRFNPKVIKYSPAARKQAIRDKLLVIVRQSDMHNRYVTAGAALERWDYHLAKAMEKGELNVNRFAKKLKLSTRYPWKAEQIRRALASGTGEGIEAAKKLYVSDVVADTQFLYGGLEAPIIGQKWGALSRTATVFQSWPMNYAHLLEKWATSSAEPSEIANKFAAWALSSFISYHIMSNLWGEGTAARRIGLGPFPTQLDAPAPWRPILSAIGTIIDVASIPTGSKSIEDVEKSMLKTIKSSMIFVPGGLQIEKSLPPLLEGDREKFFKSLVGIRH